MSKSDTSGYCKVIVKEYHIISVKSMNCKFLIKKDRRYPARYLRCKIMVTVPIRRAPILLAEEERGIDRLTDIDTCASF